MLVFGVSKVFHYLCKVKNKTKNMKKLLVLLTISLLPMAAWANDSGTCGNNLTYTFMEETHTLTISGNGDMTNYNSEDLYVDNIPWYSYKENIWNVVIEHGVTSIGNNAFYECSNLKEISIPNSVTTIGEAAFAFCIGLTNINIPNSVKRINRIAFSCCTSLTDIIIPNSVTTIGIAAFLYCSNLRSIRIPNSIVSIGSRAFNGCSNLQKVIVEDIVSWCNISFDDNPIWYAHHIYNEEGEEITALNFPNYTEYNICDRAFMFCYGLTSVTIPSSIKYVGEAAFAGCYNLSNVTIDNSTTEVGNYAFNNCFALTGGSINPDQCLSSCPDSNHPHIIDLGLNDGTLWSCCNVGANVPEEYGDYYAWGEISTKDYYYWNTYKWCEGSDNDFDMNNWAEGNNRLTKYNYDSNYGIVDDKYELDLEDDAAYMNSNGNQRMPSSAQLAHLLNNTIEEEITFDGIVGSRLASKKNGSYIFMPYSGEKQRSSFSGLNNAFKYWTRTLAPNSEYKGLYALAMGALSCAYLRYYGLPVRPVGHEGSGSNVETIIHKRNMKSSTYYTLDGRILNGKPIQRGIYIMNGRKFVIK